ncbi:Autophagy-related protein 23 [Spathaspora sp. JA1]|nr:Autophagy-related protein 23 [Spathaspora sp. JA1]
MTTPLISPERKHTHHTKPMIDESLSPVKINLKSIEPPALHHKDNVGVVIHHPHGLQAKHEARRNTSIGEKRRRSLVNTPLIDVNARRGRRGYPMTSPYLNQGVSGLESIKRAKVILDSQFEKLGKENREPRHLGGDDDGEDGEEAEALSSPIKRNKQKEVPRIEQEEPVADIVDEIDTDDVILDDLVERFSKPMPSTQEETSSPLVIDTSSEESEPEEEEVKYTSDRTQLNRIIQENSHIDYVTPQRYTEPIAQSPETNQIARINEDLKHSKQIDSTSPLKNIKKQQEQPYDRDDTIIQRLENEPTINFLMSPNSKPIFSLDQMNKIKQENNKRTQDLMSEISSRDDTIQLLNDQLNKLQRDLFDSQHQFREVKVQNGQLINNEQILMIQLKNNERELSSITKSFKIKENLLDKVSQELHEKQAKVDEMEVEIGELHQKMEKLHDLKDEVIEMNDLNEKYVVQIDGLIKERNFVQDQNEELRARVEQESELEHTCQELKENNEKLNNEVEKVIGELEEKQELNSKLQIELEELKETNEELRNTNIELKNVYEDLTNVNTDLKTTNEQLVVEKDKLTIVNQENEKLIKEYDNVAHDRISELETELETTKTKSEEEYTKLMSQLDQKTQLNQTLELKLEDIEHELSILKQEIERLETLNKDKSELLEQKETIISDDMIKLNELVSAVTGSRQENNQEIERLHQQIESLTQENFKYSSELTEIQDKLEASQSEADQEFDRLAQYLHHEYSEKHARKLGEIKLHFEKDRDNLIRDKKAAEREVELLKRKVNQMTKEFNQMSEILQK